MMLENIKSAINEKSGIAHTESSGDFESSDFFLQILDKKKSELPDDHYIQPYLLGEDEDIGEIHFLPNGNATSNIANRTEILLIGIQAIREYVAAIKNGKAKKHDRVYGRSDSEMTEVAEAMGFTTHNSKEEASRIISATPDEIIKGVKELEKRFSPETLDKIQARVRRDKK